MSDRRLLLAEQGCDEGPGPISSDNVSIIGKTPFSALMASGAHDEQEGSLMYDWMRGMIMAIEVWTALALELATGPTAATVVAGLVIGTKEAVFDVDKGAAVTDGPPVVDEARPEFVEAGEAVCETLEDPRGEEIGPDAEELDMPGIPAVDEFTDEGSGQ